MSNNRTDRETIFKRVREGLASIAPQSFPMPDTGKAFFRPGGDKEQEIEQLLAEVTKMGGTARSIRGRDELVQALAELVRREQAKTAAVSDCGMLREQKIAEILKDLNVDLLHCEGAGHNLSACDLGIAVADAILPETGTVLLRTCREQPQALSLLPRICLVLAAPSALQRDLHNAFALASGDRHFVLVSGPSRTADIEKILTLGVHGPKSFNLWVCE
jgi:L-lactate dehydrogenase complex protein LldG